MSRQKHIHKYMRQNQGYYTPVWRCALPDCSHYMPKNVENMMIGRMSICWNCGEQFVMDGEILSRCIKNMEDGEGYLKCQDCHFKESLE